MFGWLTKHFAKPVPTIEDWQYVGTKQVEIISTNDSPRSETNPCIYYHFYESSLGNRKIDTAASPSYEYMKNRTNYWNHYCVLWLSRSMNLQDIRAYKKKEVYTVAKHDNVFKITKD